MMVVMVMVIMIAIWLCFPLIQITSAKKKECEDAVSVLLALLKTGITARDILTRKAGIR